MPSRRHEFDDATYVLLREYVRERTGIVYGPSRRSIFESRVASRVSTLGLADAAAYYRYLNFHPDREQEFLELASVLTNNETYFFRESQTLDALLNQVPEAAKRRGVRALSAGASSGEELASLAMRMRERDLTLPQRGLVGVDLDVRMIETAQAGLYRAKSFRQLEPDRVVRFFSPQGEGRKLKPAIHEHLEFRWANLVDGSTLKFPHPFDLILLRNVLIYFDTATVEQVLRTLHGLLVDDGLLAVGVSESLSHIPFLFDPVRVDNVILYRKLPL